MPAIIANALRLGIVWLGRIGLAAFAVNEIKKLTTDQKQYMEDSVAKAKEAGATDDELKEVIAATTYEQVEAEGKDPEDFWAGLTPEAKADLQFSPTAVKRSMERTKFLGITSALLFVSALAAGGVAGVRGIPILVKTLGRLATARASGQGALQLMTIIEEGKILGISKVWIPGLIGSMAAAGGWLTSTMTNNLNDTDFWGRNFLGQAASDFEKALEAKNKMEGGGGTGLTAEQQARTIIRMVTEKKPEQFIGTLFSAKLGNVEQFDRKIDDEITSVDDLTTDVKINLNKWLATLPGRMGYSIIIRKDPVDEFGAKQSGIWATMTLFITHMSGKTMPIDTILLGPVDPKIRMVLFKETKTIEAQIPELLSSQTVREIQLPTGVVDIFDENNERVFSGSATPPATPPATPTATPPVPPPVTSTPTGNFWAIFTNSRSGQGFQLGPFGTSAEANTKLTAYKNAQSAKDPSNISFYMVNTGITQTNPNRTKAVEPTASSVLRVGSKGEAVKDLQRFLNTQGSNLSVDGDFGPITEQAVIRFQQRESLTVDGIVGEQTNGAIQRIAFRATGASLTG